MDSYFLLPVTYSEFLDWYNRRHKEFLGLRFIPAEVNENPESVEVQGGWGNVLIETIPEYDEDFQVLIALIATGKTPSKYQNIDVNGEGARAPALKSVDISDLQALFPLTERGARMLKSRLDSRIQLGAPLFESDVRQQDRQRNRQQAEAGGDALLQLYGLHGVHGGTIENIKDEVLDAVRAKVTGDESAAPSSMLGAVITYDRHDKPDFPSASIGSIYDYFAIVNQRLPEVCGKETRREVIESVLRPARGKLDRAGSRSNAYEVINDLEQHLRYLEEKTPLELDRCPPRAAILFLDLRDQLRRRGELDDTTVDSWADLLRGSDNDRSLAIGLWMVGAFFDFSKFADDYYQRERPPFMKEKEEAVPA